VTQRIVIIGGGFSGAIVAIHLARLAGKTVEIDIVEPRPLLGGGVAYSAPDYAHRINVPAARMSAFSDDMGHFDRWLRQSEILERDPDAAVEGDHLFPGRLEFGRYLDELVRTDAAAQAIELTHRRTRATAIDMSGGKIEIRLETNERLQADRVVLALSHPPPALPAKLQALQGDPRLIADPWRARALDKIPRDGRVLIMGTGLTMADIVASLAKAGHRGPVTAFSRRGLLPRGHVLEATDPIGDFATAPSTTALALLVRIRAEIAKAVKQGRTWQEVIDAVRRDGGKVWGALPLAERRRLLRHLRPFWDVHRYRIAPQPEAQLKKWQAEGRLDVLAASLSAVEATENAVLVTLRRRKDGKKIEAPVQAVILATGPAHDRLIEQIPVLASLAKAGRLEPDPLGLGIAVDPQSRVLDREGNPDDRLWVAGPLARERFGELMGLPQVLTHAESIARSLATRIGD
jgi:uncharacterized NAD(P)/FAD-binding protein YdhS